VGCDSDLSVTINCPSDTNKTLGGQNATGAKIALGESRFQATPSFLPSGPERIAMPHDEKTIQRFIELRAQGWTYARLMTELHVSKPTLIAWSRKHQFQINNLRAIEEEALAEKWLAGVPDRVNALGEQLQMVEAELAQRNVSDLTTPQLHALARSLRRQIEQAVGSTQFSSPVTEIPSDEYHEQVQVWQG
jgi:hypothetical protein